MLNGGKYLYVGFMCHQVAEKSLKAYISRNCAEGEIPPKIHNLIRLSDLSGLTERMSPEQSNLIEMLNPLNIEARYPEYKARLLAMLTNDYCTRLIRETEELLCWIKEQL
jgi:HEPN domain-containing protein